MNVNSGGRRREFFIVVMGWVVGCLEGLELRSIFLEDGGAKGLCEGAGAGASQCLGWIGLGCLRRIHVGGGV